MGDIVNYRGRGRKVRALIDDFKASNLEQGSESVNTSCHFEEFELSTDERRELEATFADISRQPDSMQSEEVLDIEKISQLVNSTVPNLKEGLEDLSLSEESLNALLELEKQTKNRKTAKKAVNKKLEEINSKKQNAGAESKGSQFKETVLTQDRQFSSKLDRVASRSDRINNAKLKKSIRPPKNVSKTASQKRSGKAGLIRELELNVPLEVLKDFKTEDLQEIVKEQKLRKKLIKNLEAAGLDPRCLENASTSDLRALKNSL